MNAAPMPQKPRTTVNIQTSPNYVTEYNMTNKADLYDEVILDNTTYITEYNQSRLWAFNQLNDTISTINFAPDITPLLIDKAKDKSIWFLDYDYTPQAALDHVVRYDPQNGSTTLFDLPYRAHAINFGISHDYALVTILNQDTIMMINTVNFTISYLNMTCPNLCGPGGADFDNNGNLWITDPLGERFVEYSFETGNFTFYPPVTYMSSQTYIRFEGDDTFWTGSHAGDKLVHVNITDMSHTVYTSPLPNANQYPVSGVNDIALVPNGDVWFAEHFLNRMGRLERQSGTILEYIYPRSNPLVANLAYDNNKIWYAEAYGIFSYFDLNKVPTVQVTSIANQTISNTPNQQINLDVKYISGIDRSITFSIFGEVRNWITIGVEDTTSTFTLKKGGKLSIPVNLILTGRVYANTYDMVVGIRCQNFTASQHFYLTITKEWTDSDFSSNIFTWTNVFYIAIPLMFVIFLFFNRKELATLIARYTKKE